MSTENSFEEHKDKALSQDAVISRLISDVSSKWSNTIDNLFKEGLKRKGFEFKNDYELKDFITKNCKGMRKDNETTYYVNDIPFFFYVSPTCDFSNIFKDGKYTSEFNGGSYAYL
jgi:hypothetical protein